MSQQVRRAPASPLRAIVFGLIALIVFAALGAGLWIGFHGPPASAQTSIFAQPPRPSSGAGQPLSALTVRRMHPVWSYTFSPDLPSRMVVANGIAYVSGMSATHTYLVAIQRGRQLWRFQVPGQPPASNIAAVQVGGGAVFLATTATIYALDTQTGQLLWRHQAEAPIETHGSNNDLVYTDTRLFYSTDEQVYALDATGSLVWTYRFTSDHTSAYSPFFPLLVAGDGAVYLSLTTSSYVAEAGLIALDSRSGSVRWYLLERGANSTLMPDPVVVAGGLLLRRTKDSVSALAASTGRQLWTVAVSAPGSYRGATPSMAADQHLLFLEAASHVQAYDLVTGRLVWSRAQLEGARITCGPIVSNGVVYVATVTPFAPYGHPIFMPIRVPHWLYVFDAATGTTLRMLQANDPSFEPTMLQPEASTLFVAGSRSFVGADHSAAGNPEVYALGI